MDDGLLAGVTASAAPSRMPHAPGVVQAPHVTTLEFRSAVRRYALLASRADPTRPREAPACRTRSLAHNRRRVGGACLRLRASRPFHPRYLRRCSWRAERSPRPSPGNVDWSE